MKVESRREAAGWGADSGRWTAAFLIVFAVAAAVMLGTFRQYGLTWDEEQQSEYGAHVMRWYSSGGTDAAALHFNRFEYYGALFELPATLATRWLPFKFYEARHFVNVLCALAGVVGAFALGRVADSRRAGFLSALFLLLIPEFYGHAFNNPKDIPLATVSVWALVAICTTTKGIPTLRWREVLTTAFALGCVLAVRVGAFFHLVYVVAAWSGALIAVQRRSASSGSMRRRQWQRLEVTCAVAAAGAWLTMVAFWPFAQVKPLVHPIVAIFQSAHFPWPWAVRFMGQDIPAPELPRHYILVELGIRLPEFIYVSLVCGGVAAAVAVWRRSIAFNAKVVCMNVVLIAVFVPLAVALIMRPTLYDGMRHFIFVLPPVAVLAGVGASQFAVLGISRWIRLAAGGAVGAGLVAVLFEMWQLHPYQTVYFNHAIAGGLSGARGRHETEYWGSSYREATEWVVSNYHPSGMNRIVVKNCSTDFLSAYFLDPTRNALLTNGAPGEAPDLLLATERWNCHQQPSGTLLHTITREGVPLSYVFEMHGPAVLPGITLLQSDRTAGARLRQ